MSPDCASCNCWPAGSGASPRLSRRSGEKFSTVSQRLRLLRGEGLIVRRREGTHLFYALADRHVADLIHNALAHAGELETAAGSRVRPDA